MSDSNQTNPERRRSASPSERELYELRNLQEQLEAERRKDELTRLFEVRSQKRLWWGVMLSCLLLNLIFLGLGFWGMQS